MKKNKKRKQKPKTFNKTTETINLPSFTQINYCETSSGKVDESFRSLMKP